MKKFSGNVLCLDRSDINTDEIIPAKYLTAVEKQAMGPHLLEDLELDGFDQKTDIKNASVILTRKNFGCGSSREHAPWALEANNINVVIAQNFARIFRQNMFNCGMLAIELDGKDIQTLFDACGNGKAELEVDLKTSTIAVKTSDKEFSLAFGISEFDKALVQAGGWVEYADQNY